MVLCVLYKLYQYDAHFTTQESWSVIMLLHLILCNNCSPRNYIYHSQFIALAGPSGDDRLVTLPPTFHSPHIPCLFLLLQSFIISFLQVGVVVSHLLPSPKTEGKITVRGRQSRLPNCDWYRIHPRLWSSRISVKRTNIVQLGASGLSVKNSSVLWLDWVVQCQ